MFTVQPVTLWGLRLCSLSLPLDLRLCGYIHCPSRYTPGFMVMLTILPVTPRGWWLLLLPFPLHPGVSGYVHHPVYYTPRFLVMCIVLYTTPTVFSLDIFMFNERFLVMVHFCACTPTAQNCTGEGFSNQGDTAADLRLLLSSCWIPGSFVLLPAAVKETVARFNQPHCLIRWSSGFFSCVVRHTNGLMGSVTWFNQTWFN